MQKLSAAARLVVTGLLVAASPIFAQDAHDQLAREIFKELIEINTTDRGGDNTRAAEAMAQRLLAAGFPPDDVHVLVPAPRKGNLVARLRGQPGRGAGLKPILLLAHLDVVEARREDWSFDPFTFREEGGYFYGRGTSDDKHMAAIFVANFVRLKQEHFAPSRDLILALTADEEGGDHNGVTWLLAQHRDLIDAEFCINEGGDGDMKNGKPIANQVQAAEKVYLSFQLEARNRGGHSSLPVKDNAIYQLATALVRISQHEFPVRLNEVTRGMFAAAARVDPGGHADDLRALLAEPLDAGAAARLSAASPAYNALMRTTCVATMLDGGHAENALPQTARATVNCRILPGEDPEVVRRALAAAIGDETVTIVPLGKPVPSPASPLRRDLMEAIEQVTSEMWPGVAVLPTMVSGATDGLYLRNAGIPTYGVSGVFFEVDDVRSHGQDERVGVREFYAGREFLYRLTKRLSLLPEFR